MKLIDAVIAITYKCNSHCRMCNIWRNKNKADLDKKEYAKLPPTLRYINLTGGEPFLRKDLPAIVGIIKKQCPRAQIIISSNGFAADLIIKQLKKILAIDPKIGVALSLDGVGTLHDKVRGVPGGFERVMRTFYAIKDLGVNNIRLAFTAGDYNIDQLSEVYDLAEELGVPLTLAAVHNADNYFQTKNNKIENFEIFKREFSHLIKNELSSWNLMRWARAWFAYGLLHFVLTGQRLLPAYGGYNSFFLDPMGEVFPVDIASQSMGNIKKFKNFQELWQSAKAQKVLKNDQSSQHSWMICTIRPTVRKYWFRIGLWVVKNKFF